jgi:hypothetical protein
MKSARSVFVGAGVLVLACVVAPAAAAAQPVSQPGVGVAAVCTIVNGSADRSCTPGVFNPDVTQATINSTICVPGWTKTVRPPASYTTGLKNTQKVVYGEAAISNASLEEDHLVSLELGGAPRDPQNLWPEPRMSAGTAPSGRAAEDKDREENALKANICNGSMTLSQGRQAILAHWTH